MKPVLRSGLILLGGKATRADHQAKYLFEFRGETFLSRQVRELRKVTDEILISCRNLEQAHSIPGYSNYTLVFDEKKAEGPSEGIRTGMQKASGDLVFVVACDMPLISAEIIDYLFSSIGSADAAIPVWENGNEEPLHAVYRRDALNNYFSHSSSRRLRDIISSLNAVSIPVADLRKMDPFLRSFINVNNRDEYQSLTKKEN